MASHGPLARAMRETLQLFCGEDPRVKVLCAYVDEDTMDVNELIDFWDRSRDPADQWIGSVEKVGVRALAAPVSDIRNQLIS